MLQEDIKIFSGKYYDVFPEDKEIVGITNEKIFICITLDNIVYCLLFIVTEYRS